MNVDFAKMQADIEQNTNVLLSIVKKIEAISNDCYFNLKEAAKYMKLSESTLRRYGAEIPHFQRDRVILYKKSDLDNWIQKYKVKH
ncbi:MAG TPA: helix-turn-helix domain-containing protein [Saprospiraceae bacterium]|jgi:hypothetical protein|nr:helix-turn-helix domain-containing protein [Saprospiraceae bacterium]